MALAARNGPKGTSLRRMEGGASAGLAPSVAGGLVVSLALRCRRCSSSTGMLTKMPTNEAEKTIGGSAFQPSSAPMTARSLPSPRPKPSGGVVVGVRDDAHEQVASHGADGPFGPGDLAGGKAAEKKHQHRGQRDLVGQAFGVEIDEGQHRQDCAKREVDRVARHANTERERLAAEGEGPRHEERERTGHGLDEGVASRELGAAVTAAATQQQVRKNGDVVPGEHRLAAGKTVRRRPRDRHAARNACDANVEKTAPQGPEGRRAHEQRHADAQKVFAKGRVHR